MTVRAGLIGAPAWLAACQPGDLPVEPPCVTTAPDGPVAVRIGCGDSLLDSDGRQGDFLLANPAFRAILKHPNEAQSVIGVGGGTVVDAAPWGALDELIEVVPLVAGGWVEVAEWELEADGLRLAGPVRDLPDQPADEPGAWREVTWRIHPTDNVLRAEGADGLYVHAGGEAVRYPAGWIGTSSAYVPEGPVPIGPAGAVRIEGTSLGVAAATEPFDGRRIRGRALGAQALEVFGEGGRLARIPLPSPDFELALPVGAVSVRAVAPGHLPSPRAPIADELELPVGARGTVHLQPFWGAQRPRWLLARWTDDDGEHVQPVPPEGTSLPTGPGARRVAVTGGPEVKAWDLDLDVHGDLLVSRGVRRHFDPGSRVLVAAGWPGARSRSWAGTNLHALELAAGQGLDWVVMTPEDAVPPTQIPDAPILWASGVHVTLGDHDLRSWTWPVRARVAGWGAPDPRGLGPADVLALLDARVNVVTAEMLAALGEPSLVDPPPDGVLLGPPDPDLRGLADWFRWLDARRWVVPYGPRAWLDVDDPERLGQADLNQALARGNLCATTGPLVALTVAGAPSGEVAHVGPAGAVARIQLGWTGPFDRVVLVGSGPTVLAEWTDVSGPLEVPVAPSGWWVAIAVAGDEWAVTSPVLGSSTRPEVP